MVKRFSLPRRLLKPPLALAVVLLVGLLGLGVPGQGAQGSIYVDGVKLEGASPVLIDGSNLVPMRVIFERLGASVKWDEASKTVTAIRAGREVVLTVGSSQALINGTATSLDSGRQRGRFFLSQIAVFCAILPAR